MPHSSDNGTMPEPILHFFKGLSLKAHFMWLVILLIFPFSYWYVSDPDMTDRPLIHSEGRIAWVGNPKHGYELLLESDENTNRYQRLIILDGRSSVPGRVGFQINQRLSVDRYADLVANCWIANQQVCFSRCISDLQCKQKQQADNRWFLTWGTGLTLFGYLFTLAWVARGGRIMPRSKLPDGNR